MPDILRGIAHLAERMVWDHEAGGSSPLSPTIGSNPNIQNFTAEQKGMVLLIIPNKKKYANGETVNTFTYFDMYRMIEVTIVYIHPENGWMSVLVQKVITRARQKDGQWEYSYHDNVIPYRVSLFFDEVFRPAMISHSPKFYSWKGAFGIGISA